MSSTATLAAAALAGQSRVSQSQSVTTDTHSDSHRRRRCAALCDTGCRMGKGDVVDRKKHGEEHHQADCRPAAVALSCGSVMGTERTK